MNYRLIFLIILISITCCRSGSDSSNPTNAETITPVIVDTDEYFTGGHVTTRPHNRKVIYHNPSGYWFIFYGNSREGSDGVHRTFWRSSKDGINWSERYTAYEGNSHSSSLDVVLSEDIITASIYRPEYYRKASGIPEIIDGKPWHHDSEINFSLPYEVTQYRIDNGMLIPGPIFTAMPGTWRDYNHYGSLTQDTKGFFWIGSRAVIGGESNPFQARVARSSRVNDISEWEPNHILYNASAAGSLTVQVIALDDGKVFTVIFSKSDASILGSLYDPESEIWQTPYVIAEGNNNSKRAVASFDPGTGRLHLVYVNNSGVLMHKILSTPYREQDWAPGAGSKSPGTTIVPNVIASPNVNDNISLSIDTSSTPATLAVAYHKKRPHYFLRFFNGKIWTNEEFRIGIQESNRFADEISFIRDFSDKLGLVYYVLPKKNRPGEIHFIEVPKETIISGSKSSEAVR